MIIPDRLTAGDSLRLSIPSQGRTVADGWALALVLVPTAGGARYTASTSAADPDNDAAHLLTVAASVTTLWSAGDYTWALQASRSDERATLATGLTRVMPDPAAAGTAAIDARSVARQALDAINAYLTNPDNLAAARYTINGRTLDRFPRADLMAERSKWQAEVAREESAANLAAGLPDRRRIYVRFGA